MTLQNRNFRAQLGLGPADREHNMKKPEPARESKEKPDPAKPDPAEPDPAAGEFPGDRHPPPLRHPAEQPRSVSLEETELVGAKGAEAPRITLTSIKNNIAQVLYLNPGDALDQPADSSLQCMTLCFVVTWQGFVVVGKSVAMSAANFDAEKGRLFAYEDAVRQLWPLMAFSALEARGASL